MLGIVGSGGVSSKVPTTCDRRASVADPVSSVQVGVDCSTVAAALEDSLRAWNQDRDVRDLRRSLLDVLRGLDGDDD